MLPDERTLIAANSNSKLASIAADGQFSLLKEAATANPAVGRLATVGPIALVPTGLVMELPAGIECQVRPRSGLALKHGITLTNSPGTIDPDSSGVDRMFLWQDGRFTTFDPPLAPGATVPTRSALGRASAAVKYRTDSTAGSGRRFTPARKCGEGSPHFFVLGRM